jgi:hypothetical protein
MVATNKTPPIVYNILFYWRTVRLAYVTAQKDDLGMNAKTRPHGQIVLVPCRLVRFPVVSIRQS